VSESDSTNILILVRK